MKKILVVLIILLILVSIPLTVYLVKQRQEIRKKAAPATTLALSPANVTRNVGETFSLDLVVNTAENAISAAELYVIFDSNKLEGQSIMAGSFLPVVLVNGNISGGLASITLGSQPNEPKQGTGILATIAFKALALTEGTSTEVQFAANTQVAGIGEQGNVLTGTTPASITILAAEPTPTPTPTPGPTVTPTPTPPPGTTPTPTPTPTPGPTATPTPSPTPTSGVGGQTTPTPTPTPISKTELPEAGIISPTFLLLLLSLLSFGLGGFAMLH